MEVPILIAHICVMLLSGEGTDCSYQFEQVDDSLINDMYYENTVQNGNVLAYTNHENKKVTFGKSPTWDTIEHELNHIKCKLYYIETSKNHEYCIEISKEYHEPKHFMYIVEPPISE